MDNIVIGIVTTGFEKKKLENLIFDIYTKYCCTGIQTYILCKDGKMIRHYMKQFHNINDICIFGDSFETFISFCYQKHITHLHYHDNVCFMEKAYNCGLKPIYTVHQAEKIHQKTFNKTDIIIELESNLTVLKDYINELEIVNENKLTKNTDNFQQCIEEQGKELLMLKKELNQGNKILEQCQKMLLENYLILLDVYETIEMTRKSKGYRMSLLIRRLKHQFFKGNLTERKDFILWIWAKLRNTVGGKSLNEYDSLTSSADRLLKLSNRSGEYLQLLQVQNITGAILKTSRQFFIFASVPFYDVGGGQRSAQLSNALNAMGYEVYYIYAFNSSESNREIMYLPVIKHKHIDSYSIQELTKDVRNEAVFIFEIPYNEFIPYLDYANKHEYTTIYEHIDNWDSSLGNMFYDENNFEYFINNTQYITVTAKILGEKIEAVGRHDYYYSANAVDSSLFEPAFTYKKPKDLVTGKKTLLYFGSLWGEWLDWDLLIYIAKNSDCEINLIGDHASITNKIKNLPKNFHFLGIKKHDDLPAYLAHSDIALLPFKKDVIGKYVSPLKIFEYIAMNKPVLATPLDDIMGYPNVIYSNDKEEWCRIVEQEIKVTDSTIFTAENSWYARCNKILDFIGRKRNDYPMISIIVLNHNNMEMIFRCVSSLLAFSSSYSYEIIVVDNESTDGSYEQLQKNFSGQIKLLKNNKNGCSSGRNLGVKSALGDLLLFLDSDQWVIGDHYIDVALELLLNNEEIGAVGWAAGWFDAGTCTGMITDNLPNRGIKAPWILCRTDIAYLGSGGLLLKQSLFNEIGGFDEFYDPTCFEDTDLSLKIRDAGYEIAYCPYMNIMHLPHQTTHSGSSTHTKLMARNSKYFLDKWLAINPRLLDYPLSDG